MHVHLPKPLHGWRAFVGEVGIIVLGVLIALGFEQFVSRLNTAADERAARQAIRGELELDIARPFAAPFQRSVLLRLRAVRL